MIFSQPTPRGSNSTEGYTDYAGAAEVSLPGGFYSEGVVLTFATGSDNAVIRYTLDGAEPTPESPLYTEAVAVDTTTVVRARAFEEGKLAGPVLTNTYFINERSYLPIISISTTPANLWDTETGIYLNTIKDVERLAHVELYEP